MTIQVDLSWFDELQNQGENKQKEVKERFIKWLEIPREQGELVEIRLLPPNREIKNPIKFYQHWGITEKPFNCLQTWGEECPICKLIKDAVSFVYKSDLSPIDKKELAKDIYKYQARYQYLFYAFKIVDNKPQILNLYLVRFPKTIVEEKWGVMVKNGVIDLFTPERGVPVKIMRGQRELIRMEGNLPIDITKAIASVKDEIIPLTDAIYKPKEDEIIETVKTLYYKIQKKFEKYGLTDYTPPPDIVEMVGSNNGDVDDGSDVKKENNLPNNLPMALKQSNESKIDVMSIGDLVFNSFQHKQNFLSQTTFLPVIPENIVACMGNYGYSNECNNCEFAEHCKSVMDIAKTDDGKIVYEMTK